MNKNYFSLSLSAFLLFFGAANAQKTLSDLEYGSVIERYLDRNAAKYRLTSNDLEDLVVLSNTNTNKSGLELAYVNQSYQGIKIYNAISTFAVKDNEVFSYADNFTNNLVTRVNTTTPSTTPVEAIRSFVYGLKMCCSTGTIKEVSRNGNKYVFSDPTIAKGDINVELVYQKDEETGDLQLAWDVEVETLDGNHLYHGRVDAKSGSILEHKDMVLSCAFGDGNHTTMAHQNEAVAQESVSSFNLFKTTSSFVAKKDKSKYKVLKIPTESPLHGKQEIVESPGYPESSPEGWHSDGSNSYTVTRGNNVNAYEDTGNSNGPGKQPDGGADLVFDYDWSTSVQPSKQQNAAITNLFYMGNMVHDILYKHGFDEKSGNFQDNNFGKGGKDRDAMQMEAQDGSGKNNANFSGRSDGSAGRVQMYIFDMGSASIKRDGDMDNNIISHEYGHGVSMRLTGGGDTMSCLSGDEQMGEGWSDFIGTLLTIRPEHKPETKRGSGVYVLSQELDGKGIRNYPYSTDMSINPFTYKDIANRKQTVPHGVGSVWCTMLWDLVWAYIEKYGYDPDWQNGDGGNQKVMQVVMDGMKLQKCNPGFVDGRDAILKADMALTGGKDQCMIWEVFARRGLGYNAKQGKSSSRSDQTEDFDMPPADDPSLKNCTTTSVDDFRAADYKVYPNPSNNEVFIAVEKTIGDVTASLVDVNGRVVLSKAVNLSVDADAKLNIAGLASGVYILNLKGEGVNTFDKIIKK